VDAFGWEVVGSVAGVVAVMVAIAIWLFPSPRSRDNRIQPEKNGSSQKSDLMSSPVGQGDVSSLIGVRGAGKSQLAAAVARKRIAEGWRVVAWVNAEFHEQLIEQLSQLGAEVGLGPGDWEAKMASARLRHWLEADGDRCLLIFDNATNADAILSVLPVAGKAHVIITSSRRPLSNVGRLIPVGAFTPTQAIAFLASRTGRDDESGAGALAADLGYLPLALSQAAAVLVGQNLDYATYRTRLASVQVSEYLTHVEGDSYPLGVAEAITLSMTAIEDMSGQGCRQVLELLSVLSPSGVSRRLVYVATGPDLLFTPFPGDNEKPLPAITLRALAASEEAIDEALQVLSDASLLTWSVDGSFVLVHRLVTRVVRERADHDGTLSITVDRAISILARIWDEQMSKEPRDQGIVRQVITDVTALTHNLTPLKQPRDSAYSRILEILQLMVAAYFAGYFHSYRERFGLALKKGRPSTQDIANIESLAKEMEGLQNSTAAGLISEELSEVKQYLARWRERSDSES
jgi:hypothetical protein